MEKSELVDRTALLLGDELVNGFRITNYLEWAIDILQRGVETESLYILAGFDKADEDILVEKYFTKALEELNIQPNISFDSKIEEYAVYVAKEVLEGNIIPAEGLKIMVKIVLLTEFDNKYIQFQYLEEDIELCESDYSLYNYGIIKGEEDKHILKEFELFLEVQNRGIDENIRNSIYCNDCNSISKLKLRKKFFWSISYWTCKKCKSRNFFTFHSQKGKEKILDALKNKKL